MSKKHFTQYEEILALFSAYNVPIVNSFIKVLCSIGPLYQIPYTSDIDKLSLFLPPLTTRRTLCEIILSEDYNKSESRLMGSFVSIEYSDDPIPIPTSANHPTFAFIGKNVAVLIVYASRLSRWQLFMIKRGESYRAPMPIFRNWINIAKKRANASTFERFIKEQKEHPAHPKIVELFMFGHDGEDPTAFQTREFEGPRIIGSSFIIKPVLNDDIIEEHERYYYGAARLSYKEIIGEAPPFIQDFDEEKEFLNDFMFDHNMPESDFFREYQPTYGYNDPYWQPLLESTVMVNLDDSRQKNPLDEAYAVFSNIEDILRDTPFSDWSNLDISDAVASIKIADFFDKMAEEYMFERGGRTNSRKARILRHIQQEIEKQKAQR